MSGTHPDPKRSAALQPHLTPLQVDDELLLLDAPNGRIIRLDATATHRLTTGEDELTDALDSLGLTDRPSRRQVLNATALTALGITILALPTAAAASSTPTPPDTPPASDTDDEPDPPPEVAPATGTLDAGFDPNANGRVRALAVQSDGKILIGGDFTTVAGGSRDRIARLNSDGTLDTGFNPNANSTVRALAVQSDGKILIGGNFSSITIGTTTRTRNHIARLNTNGTLDSFDPGATNTVWALAVQQSDEKILVGGTFLNIGGNTRNRIARLNTNGSLDTGFNPNANSTVRALAVQSDGKILIGGNFTSIGTSSRNRIARLNTNGTVDTDFFPSATGDFVNALAVEALAVQSDGKILIGGDFTSITIGTTTITRNRIARLDTNGTVDTGFNPNASSIVHALAVQSDGKSDGKILIGGIFTTVGGVTRNNLARLNTDGALDTGFNLNASSTVDALAVQSDGKILVGGQFGSIGGISRNCIARLT